jgi:hypothetical protein
MPAMLMRREEEGMTDMARYRVTLIERVAREHEREVDAGSADEGRPRWKTSKTNTSQTIRNR